MKRFFWFVTAAFLALAIHISYVLFMPGFLFQKKISTATDGKPVNSFFIMPSEKQALLFPTATADDVVGICKFDLGAGKLVLSAQLPKTYWTLSIYTESGRQIYALDDVQAGSTNFTIDLSRAKTVLQQLMGSGDAEDAGQIENLGWHVETTERRGLAVVWIPLADALMRKEIEDTVRASRCEPKTAAN
jgi:uncharacterized membrane protein